MHVFGSVSSYASITARDMLKVGVLDRYPRQEESECSNNTRPPLPLALKPSTRGHDGNTLIHDDFADGEVSRDP